MRSPDGASPGRTGVADGLERLVPQADQQGPAVRLQPEFAVARLLVLLARPLLEEEGIRPYPPLALLPAGQQQALIRGQASGVPPSTRCATCCSSRRITRVWVAAPSWCGLPNWRARA